MSQFEQLKENIDQYLTRYYLEKTIKGGLVTLIFLLSSWLIVALLEHWGRFDTGFRTMLFYSFLALIFSVVVFNIIIPFLRLFKLIPRIPFERAANMIGSQLETVDDKLANTLFFGQNDLEQNRLLLASIEQRSHRLNRISFNRLIDLKHPLRLAKYLVLPAITIALVGLYNPAMLFDSSFRVISHNQSFIPPAPFSFTLITDSLNAPEGEPFTIKAKTEGSEYPSQAFIQYNGSTFRMKSLGNGQFAFTFDRLLTSIDFKLSAAGITSADYRISVLPKPKLLRNIASITYPKYIGLVAEKLENRSQIRVPAGSKIDWSFDTKNADEVQLQSESKEYKFQGGSSTSTMSSVLYQAWDFELLVKNSLGLKDTIPFEIDVVVDEHPSIKVEEAYDSNYSQTRFFNGQIIDDYGFSRLEFHLEQTIKGETSEFSHVSMAIDRSQSEQGFNHVLQLDSYDFEPGASVSYYFEVWDNDGVLGAKSTKSTIWTENVLTEDEAQEQEEIEAKRTKNSMDKQLQELDKLNEEIKAFKKDLLQKKKQDWQDKERLKSLLDQQRKIMETLMKRAKTQRQQMDKLNRINEKNEDILNKQEQIQKMFDELFDDSFKEKYDEYNKLLDKLNKEKTLDQLDEMTLDNEKLEKELDRTLELFKQLEFEKQVNESIQKAEELKNAQEELESKSEEKANSNDDLKSEQDALKDELDELKEELEQLDKLNEALEEKQPLPETSDDAKKAEDAMKESSESLEKGKRKQSKDKQKEAKEALEDVSSKLSAFQKQQAQESAEEDLDDMRQLLENLVDLSHDQESVMQRLKTTKSNDPQFVALSMAQKKIIDDTKVVEDSLLALSKRVPEIGKKINDEISDVKQSMGKALDNMTNQRPNQEKIHREKAVINQQLSMTSLNNLAIMFDQIINQMQKSMNSKMKGNGQCEKPGNGQSGKPSMSDMKKMQKGLNEQLKNLKEALEKGKSPGGQKPGQKPGQGMGKMSKELAKMAAQQEAIREQLRELSNQIEGEGGKPGSGLKALEKMMEQTEEDLLYQNITQQTLDRQQEIMTKLLESEKAEREREMEQKRESKPNQDSFEIPSEIWEKYKLEKEKELEYYKTLPPNLKPYYRKRVNRYFSQLPE